MANPFQSTPSAWRETRSRMIGSAATPFQSTPSAWRETYLRLEVFFYEIISIHSLRMEGDGTLTIITSSDDSFQSTPSAWRETVSRTNFPISVSFQSTPSAWRETPLVSVGLDCNGISIHSLRMEGDRTLCICACLRIIFQSTPSAWRETGFA